jgi:tetratricopeptide (TPR) repeat protein
MRRSSLILVLLAVLVGVGQVAGPVVAGPKKASDNKDEEEIDYLALAARLIRDGHYDRAELTLAEVDENDEDLDRTLYYVLRGLIALDKKVYAEAATAFEKAIRAGNTDPLVYLNLARSRFGMNDYRGTVKALDAAGPAALNEPQAELIKSRAYWELGDAGGALRVLSRAGERFPEIVEFARTEIYYLVELGLYQELARSRKRFLGRSDIEARDLAAIGEALRQGGRLDEAAETLEAARLRFPDELLLTVQLARVLMDREEPLSSAILLEEAARHDPKYLVEAAELYRRAGRLQRALFINQRVSDQKAKLKQRLQILLELEDYEKIAAAESRLSRLGLLADEQVRYAMAFAFFQIRDFTSAERHVKALTDPDLFRKGIELRKAMEDCKAAGWMCE